MKVCQLCAILCGTRRGGAEGAIEVAVRIEGLGVELRGWEIRRGMNDPGYETAADESGFDDEGIEIGDAGIKIPLSGLRPAVHRRGRVWWWCNGFTCCAAELAGTRDSFGRAQDKPSTPLRSASMTPGW